MPMSGFVVGFPLKRKTTIQVNKVVLCSNNDGMEKLTSFLRIEGWRLIENYQLFQFKFPINSGIDLPIPTLSVFPSEM